MSKVLSVLLFFIMLTSTMYMNYSILRIFTALFAGLIIISFILSKTQIKLKFNLPVLVIFYLFIFTSLLAALANADTELLLGSIFWVVLLFAFFIVLPSMGKWRSNKMVYRAIMFTHIPIIFIPLAKGLVGPPYLGIFNNGNSFGIACVTLLVAVISKFGVSLYNYMFNDKRIGKRPLLYYSIVVPSLIMLTMYSGSRTAFITAIVILIIPVILLSMSFLRKATKRQFIKGLKLTFSTSILTGISFWVFPIKEKYEEIILHKFQLKSNNLLSDRGAIWSETVTNATMFGNGRDYFSGFDHGAHNTFISLLGQYGWLPTSIFIFLLVVLIMMSLKYSFKAINDEYRYLPLISLITFIVLSTGEGMLFKAPMIGAFACAGAVTYLMKSKVAIEKNEESIEKVVANKRRLVFKKITWN